VNPWGYVLAGYTLTAVSVLLYLISLGWRKRAVDVQCEALKRRQKDAAG